MPLLPSLSVAVRHFGVCTAVIGACFVGACSQNQNVTLYPVQGPYSEQKPLPVLRAVAHNVQRNSGTIEVVMPDGEKCEGKWASAAGQVVGTVHTTLMSQYGPVTGFGTYSGTSGGTNRGEAFLICDRSTTIQAEFFTGSGTANGYGVAKDSNGNVYKMIF